MNLQYKQELEPNQIIDQALSQGITDFYVGYSGGKDSGIVLDIIAKNYPDNFRGVVFADTGIGTQATIDFVKSYCNEKKYPLFIISQNDMIRKKDTKLGKKGGKFNFSYTDIVLEHGFPKQGVHTIVMRKLKYIPLRYFILSRIEKGEKPAVISGIRKFESQRRSKWATESIHKDGKMCFISPILYKRDDWVYRYFLENNIKRSPVYETLHISGDCLCGCFAKKDELKLLEMFHPDVFKKIKDLENEIKIKGTKEAKKYSTWGNGGNTKDIESQTTMESFVCSDCILDRSSTDEDTKRFNDEFEDIEAKLEIV